MDTNRIKGPGYYPRRPSRVDGEFKGVPHIITVRSAYGDSWDSIPWQGSGTYTVRAVSGGARITKWTVTDINGQELFTHVYPEPKITTRDELLTLVLRNPAPQVRGAWAASRWTFTEESA